MKIETIIVESEELTRIDRYLRRIFPLLTQGIIESYLRKAKIKVNGQKIKSNARIHKGDVIDLFTNTLDSYKNIAKDIKIFSDGSVVLANKLLKEYLVAQTEKFIAINKPYGLAVQGGSKISLSIDDALSYLNYINNTNYKLVHRLDKETSGVLIIANGYDNAAKLGKMFQDRSVKKTYIAVVSGKLRAKEGVISNKLGKKRGSVYEIVQELADGKDAESFYKVLKERNDVSLVEFKPNTGRMHQLRIHSKLLHCPIVGDTKYGGPSFDRMLLHAKEIILPLDVFGEVIKITTELPIGFDIEQIYIK